MSPDPYYRRDLARIHHLGFGFHAEDTAPGILALLEPVLARRGLVHEFGCGSGLLTRHLVEAGHRVLATDASPAMVELARTTVGDDAEVRRLTLPDDQVPSADAIVSVGHVLSYLPNEDAIDRALVALAGSLAPGGILAFDICDRSYGGARREQRPVGWQTEDWALVTETSVPTPDRFVRQMAIFTRNEDGSWRRDDECHYNVLVDTSRIPPMLAGHGVEAHLGSSFGGEELPEGLQTIVGRRVA